MIDLFVSALDQVGVLEMKSCFDQTGGFYVMTDSFGNPVFKESFKKFFEVDEENGELKMGFLGETKLLISKEAKIQGVVGQATAVKDKTINTAMCSDDQIGVGGTNKWYIGGLDRNKTLAYYFDIVNTTQSQQHIKVHMQFKTCYQHSNGTRRLRVTTCQRLMTPGENYRELAYGFDQETAAVLTARQSIISLHGQESMDVIRWLDRLLIKVVSRFAEYKKDDASSFSLSKEFNIYPQFMFYLRRS